MGRAFFATASEPQIIAKFGPAPLPGKGKGTLLSTERQQIKEATGCSASIRGRKRNKGKKQQPRALNISGPPEKIREAFLMAEAFVLASQARPDDGSSTSSGDCDV